MGTMQRLIWVLWPSFLVGGLMDVIFFTLFDPLELDYKGELLIGSRLAAYSFGFFVFWAFAAGSSALTCFFQRRAADINRLCPLEPEERPQGCPKRR